MILYLNTCLSSVSLNRRSSSSSVFATVCENRVNRGGKRVLLHFRCITCLRLHTQATQQQTRRPRRPPRTAPTTIGLTAMNTPKLLGRAVVWRTCAAPRLLWARSPHYFTPRTQILRLLSTAAPEKREDDGFMARARTTVETYPIQCFVSLIGMEISSIYAAYFILGTTGV